MFRKTLPPAFYVFLGSLVAMPALAAPPSVDQALGLKPIQRDVEYDRPDAQEATGAKISSEKMDKGTAWVVRGSAGQMLRVFADTNSDNKVDQWRYFSGGIESYRDIDANFNGKADQYRWLGLSGTRWGLDANEDGEIDRWQVISAEEVTSEIVAAVRNRDPKRFALVLLSDAELRSLGLDAQRAKRLSESIRTASRRFQQHLASQRVVEKGSRWVNFGATWPGVVPAGTDGSRNDVTVYENVVAMMQTNGKHGQLSIGTLVKAGDLWRAVDVPLGLLSEKEALEATSYVLQPAQPADVGVASLPEGSVNEKIQKLATEMEKIEKSLLSARAQGERVKLLDRQAEIFAEMAEQSSTKEERMTWLKQLADGLSTAVQTDDYPDGIDRLGKLIKQYADGGETELESYTTFRLMTAQYAQALKPKDAKFQEIQENWQKQLEDFVKKYPGASDRPEAMLQLAMNEEFAENAEEALAWYKQVISDGSDTPAANKAKGAVRRLTSVGRPITITGKTTENRTFSTNQLKGRIVLLHYWATWNEACLQDNKAIQELAKKYGARGFMPVGICVETDKKQLNKYLSEAKLSWPQLHESGGLDGPLSVDMGILTVPTMILLDDKGNVVNRNIHVHELEELLRNNLASRAARSNNQ